jgi:uncharacterized ParB-like nuclease family protein
VTASSPEHSTSMVAFNAARRRAFVQDVLAELSGRPEGLLSFADVEAHLRPSRPQEPVHLEEIPLRQIVGSVGRYQDFNRAFLPRSQIDAQRWTHIDQLRRRFELPPIEVFRMGDVYFVRDGNHRVSVARARGQRTIRARVVDLPIRVPLEADTSPHDLILKSGYAEFLENTSLDQTHPRQRIELTRPGSYRALLQHIEVHQFYMGLRSRHYPTLAEAASDWYQHVYQPVVERIRSSGILRHFPGRTEADLYLWIAENRARLQMRYATTREASEAVDDFAQEHRLPQFVYWLRRALHRLFPRFVSDNPQAPTQPKTPEDR